MKSPGTTAGLLLALASLEISALAQLAITEIMAGPDRSFNGPDYWELTNFGTRAIQLDGYSIEDKSGKSSRLSISLPFPFDGITIQAGESVIFFRRKPTDSVVTTASEFRAWWGDSRLPPGLQIKEYERPGLSGDPGGDALILRDAANQIVDQVIFDESLPGRSLVYAPTTGACCNFSIPEKDQAFRAELSADVGSPGHTTGPISLTISQEPEDQLVDAGMDVRLTVAVGGLPRPRFQWFVQGVAKVGETSSTLVLPNVSPADEGTYQVRIENGTQERFSRVAVVRVNTTPVCASLSHLPVNAAVFPGQTVAFAVRARGFPPPQYQWEANGMDLPGETNRTLVLADVDSDLTGTIYRVRVCNVVTSETCCVTGEATLTVTRRPQLTFTEVMAAPLDEGLGSHQNWFELMNSGSVPVNLGGYRLADSDTALGLGSAFVIEGPLLLEPNETVVFVENLTPAAFRRWWGSEALAPNLQIVTFHGFGLSEVGEVLFLWNPAAIDPSDTVATASWSIQLPGVSVEFEDISCSDDFGCSSQINRDSVMGRNGAFRAAEGSDLGSPGYTVNPQPFLISMEQAAPGLKLHWRVTEGKSYQLKIKNALTDSLWVFGDTQLASSAVLTLRDIPGTGVTDRFYRLDEVP